MQELIKKYVDKKAIVNLGGLNVEVTVKDVKISYGKERFLITPVSGSGEVWVESIKLIEK